MLEPKVEGALEEEEMDDAAEEEAVEGEEGEEQVPEEEKLVFPADMVHLIVFWTSWAPPCRSALPRVSKLGKKHADCLNVVAVTTEKESQVLGFVDELEASIPNVSMFSNGESWWKCFAEPFGVHSVPHAFVLDKTSKLVWHGHPCHLDCDKVVAAECAKDAPSKVVEDDE